VDALAAVAEILPGLVNVCVRNSTEVVLQTMLLKSLLKVCFFWRLIWVFLFLEAIICR